MKRDMKFKENSELTQVERLGEFLALVLVILVLLGCFIKVLFI